MDESKTKASAPPLNEQKSIDVRLKMSECPVSRVTVFGDRAEVTRAVHIRPERAGPHEIWVQGVTSKIDEESVRVKGVGSCEIQEVSVDTHTMTESSDDLSANEREIKIEQFNAEIKAIDREVADLRDRIVDTSSQLHFIHEYVEGMTTKLGATNVTSPPAASLKENDTDYLVKLNQMYSTSTLELKREAHQLQYQIDDATEKIRKIQIVRDRLQRGREVINVLSRDVTILIDAADASIACGVELSVTYLVNDASWSPSYDIRILSEDNSMSLTYFGLVKQGTGEDWNNCEIKLSTAKPCVGGYPPLLPNKTASFTNAPKFYPAQPAASRSAARDMNMNAYAGSQMYNENALYASGAFGIHSQAHYGAELFDVEQLRAPPQPVQTSVATASVTSDAAGSTTFTIPRQATIESDNKAHKVTIGIMSLQPTIMHYVPGAVDANAYFQAKTRNTSDYLFLPSEKVSVFFDGNFVTTTSMKFVSPGEMFQNFLGRDPAVRVDYRPVRQTDRVTGLISKTLTSVYEQNTIVTNNKQVPIKLIVADVLPRSTDERIKIELQSPTMVDIKRFEERKKKLNADGTSGGVVSTSDDVSVGQFAEDATESVSQNALTNNIVWTRTMDPGTSSQFSLTFSVAHSVDQPVYIN